MNYKLLLIPTTVFASALTLAVACQPCEDDECNFDEDGGGEGGQVGSGGTTGSGGAGGTNGSGGAATTGGQGGMGGGPTTSLDCLTTGQPTGTPGSCEPAVPETDDSYDCQACAAEYCCEAVEACAATGPVTACYYGSTSRLGFDEEPIVGELDCILDCLREISDDDFVGDQAEVDTCAEECGSAECDETEAGPASAALAACLIGIDNETAPAGCQYECAIRFE